jgi:hypothetical protein
MPVQTSFSGLTFRAEKLLDSLLVLNKDLSSRVDRGLLRGG